MVHVKISLAGAPYLKLMPRSKMRWFPPIFAARKMSKCGVLSGPYFAVFGLNTGKYGPEKSVWTLFTQ